MGPRTSDSLELALPEAATEPVGGCAFALPDLAETLVSPGPAAINDAAPAATLFLEGLGLIEAGFGEDGVLSARDHAVRIASRDGSICVVVEDDDCLILRGRDTGGLGSQLPLSRIAATAAEISLTPFEFGGETLLLTARPRLTPGPARRGAMLDRPARAKAREVLSALCQEANLIGPGTGSELDTRWAAVGPLGAAGPALYYRMSLASGPLETRDANGQAQVLACPREFAMVEAALAELSQQEDVCISVSLSPAWLVAPDWQAALIERVRRAGRDAARLILAATAARGDHGNWTILAGRLRRSGAAIGVAQFGVAPVPVSDVIAMAPDVIELSGRIVAGAARSDRFAAALPSLVTLARSLAPILIVGEVDSADCARWASASGIDWGWGDAIRAPSIARPWRFLRLVKD